VIVTLLVLEIGTRVLRGQLFDRSLLSSRFEAGDADERPYAEYHPRLGWVPNLGVRTSGGVTSTVLAGNVRSNGADATPPGRPVINAGVGNYGLDQAG
jgi:hypothetical protein